MPVQQFREPPGEPVFFIERYQITNLLPAASYLGEYALYNLHIQCFLAAHRTIGWNIGQIAAHIGNYAVPDTATGSPFIQRYIQGI